MTVVSATDQLIGGVSSKTAAAARRELERRGVELHLGKRATGTSAGVVTLDDGLELDADLVIWATSAVGPPLLSRFGLSTNAEGFLRTRGTLQSVDDPAIFAVGDTGTIEGERIPKAGVYAVRQGPVLWENLKRYLRGEPPREYRPQTGFLKLFNTGDGTAIGEYKGFTFSGQWAWRLKDWIDSRFMRMYQVESLGRAGDERNGGMGSRTSNSGRDAARGQTAEPRCAGCGGKVGSSVLSRALSRLDDLDAGDVVVGLGERDDAAVIQVPGSGMVNFSVDFFTAPFDDPFLVGRVAALHAASDSFACGGKPMVALCSATLPLGPEAKQEQLLYELLAGALHEFRPMGVALAGGHTTEGSPLTIGFSMLAAQDRPPRTKGQLRVGDQLVLTKPLGIGILLAAHMRARCRAAWWEPLVHTMLFSNQYAAGLCDEFDVAGLTDVTGFGLAGHLMEMLRASGAGAELSLNSIPLLPGVSELLREGLESTLAPANRSVEAEMDAVDVQRTKPQYRVLFDPQTSGGLLMGVPERRVPSLLSRLAQQSAVPSAVIGRVVDQEGAARIRVR
jgi:selenide,water dikinase